MTNLNVFTKGTSLQENLLHTENTFHGSKYEYLWIFQPMVIFFTEKVRCAYEFKRMMSYNLFSFNNNKRRGKIINIGCNEIDRKNSRNFHFN